MPLRAGGWAWARHARARVEIPTRKAIARSPTSSPAHRPVRLASSTMTPDLGDLRVDLRSDTVTKPSAAMRAAMRSAEVGDDVYGEDPTVRALEQYGARLLGKEAALFLPTGTMANLVCIAAGCGRGDELVLGDRSHVFNWEAGGPSALLGVTMRTLPNSSDGTIAIADLADVRRDDDEHCAPTRMLCLENSHNECGGRVLSPEYMDRVGVICRRQALHLHVDGARLLNAATHLDVAPSRIASAADSVTLCLSKGVGAPLGSLAAGDAAFISRARRARKLLGGGMRQAGVAAAAALVGLRGRVGGSAPDGEPWRAQMRTDHENALLLRNLLGQVQHVVVDNIVETNIVHWRLLSHCGVSATALCTMMEKRGILLGQAAGYGGGGEMLRAVTHVGVTREQVESVAQAVQECLEQALAKSHTSTTPTTPTIISANVSCEGETQGTTQRVELIWSDGRRSEFSTIWLRDHDPSCMHPTSMQRQVDTWQLLDNPVVLQIEALELRRGERTTAEKTDLLRIDWAQTVQLEDGSEHRHSEFSDVWLRANCCSDEARAERMLCEQAPPRIWGRDVEELPRVSAAALLDGGDGRRNAMRSLRDVGALVVENTPTTVAGTREIIEVFGLIRRTFYGDMWDTAAPTDDDSAVVNDTAYTNLELRPHTDCTYLSDPPGLQFFNCVQQAQGSGGATWLVDGFAVAAKMRSHHPEAFDFFSSTPITFECIDTVHHEHTVATAPVFSLSDCGSQVTAFRYNNDDRAPLLYWSRSQIDQFYEHLPKLLGVLRSPAMAVELKLQTSERNGESFGEMIVVTNQRWMHGRRAFIGRRNLVGAYMERDCFESTLRTMGLNASAGASL